MIPPRLDKGPHSKIAHSIAKRAAKHQSDSRKIKRFRIGKDRDGDPKRPERWRLYSPRNPPTITRTEWYDPTGEHGYPVNTILDDQAAANVLESGMSKEERRWRWPGNFGAGGVLPTDHRHLGRPARTAQAILLRTQFHYHSYTFTGDTTRYPFKNEDEGGARTRELPIVSGRHGSDPTYLVHTPEKAILAAENPTTPCLAAPAALDKSEPMMLHTATLLAKTSQRLIEELVCASTISNEYTAIFAKLSTDIHKVLASTFTAQEKSEHIIRLLADKEGDIERAKRKGLEIQAFLNRKLPKFLRSSSLPGVAVPKTVTRYTDLAGLRDDELRQPLNDVHFRTISPAVRQRRLSRLIGEEEVETSAADAESQLHQDVFNGFEDIPEREVIVIEDSEGEDIALGSRKRGRAASQKGERSRKSRRTRENGSEVAKAETPHGTRKGSLDNVSGRYIHEYIFSYDDEQANS